MEKSEIRRLREYYHVLLGQQHIIDGIKVPDIESVVILPLEEELLHLNSEFPKLVLPFNKHLYFSHSSGGGVYYNLTSIRIYLAATIGRLQIAIEQPWDTPVTERREFGFIKNMDLRSIIERDYVEIQKAYISGCWKSVIILCGGAIEAILTDMLTSNETAAKGTKSAPKNNDITRWDFSDLISVAVELKFLSAGVDKLSHSLREYRNLVHPGNELRNKLRFDAEEARIAVELLNIVHRDSLS